MPPSHHSSAPAPADTKTAEGVAGIPTHRPVSKIRDNVDALVVAFLLAMFIRTFVVELFMIPSPSMTPTLLGTENPHSAVGFIDLNDDGIKDMLLWSEKSPMLFDMFLRDGARYRYAGIGLPGSDGERERWRRAMSVYQDRILVAKFPYWFAPPRRGDIIVFKVPETIFERDKPIFIKRAVGLPGETLSFEPATGVRGHENTMGYLMANGERVTRPAFFEHQLYECRNLPPNNFAEIRVPEDGVFAMGDNTVSSLDSRFWGPVPLDHLRGRAIFRYNPRYFPFTKDPGFLN